MQKSSPWVCKRKSLKNCRLDSGSVGAAHLTVTTTGETKDFRQTHLPKSQLLLLDPLPLQMTRSQTVTIVMSYLLHLQDAVGPEHGCWLQRGNRTQQVHGSPSGWQVTGFEWECQRNLVFHSLYLRNNERHSDPDVQPILPPALDCRLRAKRPARTLLYLVPMCVQFTVKTNYS